MLMTKIVLFPCYRCGSYRSKVVRNISKPVEVYRSRNQNQVNYTANSFWRGDSNSDSVTGI